MKRALLVIVLCLFAASLFATNAELESIRQAIKESGAKWQASLTFVSMLSKEEREGFLGWQKDLEPEIRERSLPPGIDPNRDFPTSLDWRSHEGKNYITPVRDQASCGSCWAFGALGAMEGMMNIEAGCEDMTTNMSEQELLSCSPGSCGGWTIAGVMGWLQQFGVSEEDCFSYQANSSIPCDNRCDHHMYTNRKSKFWGWAFGYVYGIKLALMNGPLNVGFTVYNDFFSYDTGVYSHESGGEAGGHAVTMVGWNDADSCWIVKNSWGPGWGESGYFRIKWGECGIEGSATWMTMKPAEYPKIVYLSNEVDDYIGNSDGVLNPGEQANIIVTVKNTQSWGDTQFVVDAVLKSDDSRITIVDSTANYGTILAGETKDNTSDAFEVLALSDTSSVPITMTLYMTAVGALGSYLKILPFTIEYMPPGVEETEEVASSTLFKVYPNPFKGKARIVFSCEKGQRVRVSIYNIAGQKVKEINSEGDQTQRIIEWDGTDGESRRVPAGVYSCVVRTDRGEEITTQLIKIE